ncbi:hypothetical protein BDZ45DRAFT_730888 [Acephala macrosclerotiorum]|nr:hypothetical protein BDZ45DRAFT_730888 [Acephala macrosclerotiorum]
MNMEAQDTQEGESEIGANTNTESESVGSLPITDGHWKLPNFSEPVAMVAFVVGPDDEVKEFQVHKDVVCFYSSVLRAELNNGFVEGQIQTYRLLDASPGTVDLLIQWLYFQKLKLEQLQPSTKPSVPNKIEEDLNLAGLWVLADKFRIPSLQNLVVTSMVRIGTRYRKAPSETFSYIYKNTAAGSALRDLAVHQCARMTPRALIRRTPDLFPKQMRADLAYYLIGEEHDLGDDYCDPELDDARSFFVPME